jgi:HlyD family secretion protein
MSSMDSPVVLPWWRRRSCKIAGAISLAVVVCALWVWRFDGSRHVRIGRDQLTIATVRRDTFRDFIPLRARVVPRATIYLDAVEGGRVEQVMVEPGDMVAAGQPLVRLSNTELELVVLDREARLIESITQLQARQSSLEQDRLNNSKALARIDYDIVRLERALNRRKTLASESQEQRDNLQDELAYNRRLQPYQVESNERQEALRVQQLPQIAAQLTKLHEDVEITRAKLANLMVRAPVAGRMTAIELTVGENRNRGERLGELTPDSGMKLVAAVDEYYLGRLRPGQSATATLEGREMALEVERVYPQVKGGTFTVDVRFAGMPPGSLTPGQTVQGKFTLGAATTATILDVGPFLQESAGEWVFVLDKAGGSASRRQIRSGRRNVEQLEVLAGLEPGERVITSNYQEYGGVARIDIH